MIYLSKLSFAIPPRFLRKQDVCLEHSLIMSLFPDELGDNPRARENILWRKEVTGHSTYYYIQSTQEPSLDWVRNQEVLRGSLQTREVTELYEKLLARDSFSYKARINPAIKRQGKIIPVVGQDSISKWWKARTDRFGMTLQEDALIVMPENVASGQRKDSKITINSATIVGRATAKDSQALFNQVVEGVGREKSYGFGLVLLGA